MGPTGPWNLEPYFHPCVTSILMIMCPFKKVTARKKVTPWITPDIYRAIREKQVLIKRYKSTKDPELLTRIRAKRNSLNSMIDRAKTDYIMTSLSMYAKKPKKF